MRRILSLAGLVCLLAAPVSTGPAFGANGTLCAGRVELVSVTPQWNVQAPGNATLGLTVTVANRSGEAILLQPNLMMGGRPQVGHPIMVRRHGEAVFALRLGADHALGLPPAELIRALGATCRLT